MIVHTPREFGQLVRDHRIKVKLTQALLAKNVGVSRKWIIDLEGGKPSAEFSLVLRTLRSLGIELDARSRTERTTTDGFTDLDVIVAASGRSPK